MLVLCVCLSCYAANACSVQLATGGVATFLFWRSAYISTLFSLRNRVLVSTDWLATKLFGRYERFLSFYLSDVADDALLSGT